MLLVSGEIIDVVHRPYMLVFIGAVAGIYAYVRHLAHPLAPPRSPSGAGSLALSLSHRLTITGGTLDCI